MQINIKYCISPLSLTKSKSWHIGNTVGGKKKEKLFSCVQLFVNLLTVAYQAPPSIGFSRQEHWSGLPFPSPGDLPDPGIKPRSPTLQADALLSEPLGKPKERHSYFWWELPSRFYGGQFGNINIISTCAFCYSNLLVGIYLVDKLAHTGSTTFVQDYSL